MKRIFLCFVGLLLMSVVAVAQEVPVPESLKTVPDAKCYWSYSVERKNTKRDSIHNYIIRFYLEQVDNTGKYREQLKLKNAHIYCSFVEGGVQKKIFFKQKGKGWIAKFKIHTSQSLPVKIIANYNHQEKIMPLKLNEGVYPGEPDN